MTNCERCSRTLREGAYYCDSCGAYIGGISNTETKRGYGLVGLLFAMLGLSACLGALAAFMFLNRMPVLSGALYIFPIALLVVGFVFITLAAGILLKRKG